MRLVNVLIWALLVSGLPSGPMENCAQAQEKKGEVLYKGEGIGPNGLPVERDFNITKKEEDLKELTTLLQEGHVLQLTKEKEPNPLDIMRDLCRWPVEGFGHLY